MACAPLPYTEHNMFFPDVGAKTYHQNGQKGPQEVLRVYDTYDLSDAREIEK